MKMATKIWLFIAVFLLVLGLVTFTCVMAINKWDFASLNTLKYETNNYEITDDFSNISINTTTVDILILPSVDETCKVVCQEQEKLKHSVTVLDETLTINESDTRKWYEHISIFSFGNSKITVYLPKAEYDKLRIKTSTGDIFVEDISASDIELSVSTGEISAQRIVCSGDIKTRFSTGDTKMTDVTCKSLISEGNTGDIDLERVIVEDKIQIKTGTGDIEFNDCDGGEIFMKTSTGDVEGSLLTEKIFITETGTGSIKVPQGVSGGKCEIITSTGDINIKIDSK